MRVTDRRFLLRVWRDARREDAWRATLQDLRSGEVRHFRDLAGLVRHLRQRTPEEAASE